MSQERRNAGLAEYYREMHLINKISSQVHNLPEEKQRPGLHSDVVNVALREFFKLPGYQRKQLLNTYLLMKGDN